MAYTFDANGGIVQGLSNQNYTLPAQQATQSNLAGVQASNLADPANRYKGDWSAQLDALFKNPGNINSNPWYQFGRDQGLENITRAHKGMDSGGLDADRIRFGTDYASTMFPKLTSLYTGAIGGSAPVAAQMQLGGFTRAQDQQSMALANKQAVQTPNSNASPTSSFDIDALMKKYGITPQGTSTPVGGPASGGGYGLPSGYDMSAYNNYGAGNGYGGDATPTGGYWAGGGGYNSNSGQPQWSDPSGNSQDWSGIP